MIKVWGRADSSNVAKVLWTLSELGLPYERVDHAWFAGFAPASKPRIAFAVLVEHGGHGGAVAAPVAMEVPCPAAGVISAIDGQALGMAVVHLGGGRLRESDRINPSVGLSELAGLGEAIGRGDPLGLVHAATVDQAEAAVAAVQRAYTLGETVLSEQDLVLKRIG